MRHEWIFNGDIANEGGRFTQLVADGFEVTVECVVFNICPTSESFWLPSDFNHPKN